MPFHQSTAYRTQTLPNLCPKLPAFKNRKVSYNHGLYHRALGAKALMKTLLWSSRPKLESKNNWLNGHHNPFRAQSCLTTCLLQASLRKKCIGWCAAGQTKKTTSRLIPLSTFQTRAFRIRLNQMGLRSVAINNRSSSDQTLVNSKR